MRAGKRGPQGRHSRLADFDQRFTRVLASKPVAVAQRNDQARDIARLSI
jgi:hypothetical protein